MRKILTVAALAAAMSGALAGVASAEPGTDSDLALAKAESTSPLDGFGGLGGLGGGLLSNVPVVGSLLGGVL